MGDTQVQKIKGHKTQAGIFMEKISEKEPQLHWSLDVSFNDDGCRVCDENAAVNLSWLRKFVLGLLKKELSFKAIFGVSNVMFAQISIT